MGVVTTLKSEQTHVIQLLLLNLVSINEKVNGYEWMLNATKLHDQYDSFEPVLSWYHWLKVMNLCYHVNDHYGSGWLTCDPKTTGQIFVSLTVPWHG